MQFSYSIPCRKLLFITGLVILLASCQGPLKNEPKEEIRRFSSWEEKKKYLRDSADKAFKTYINENVLKDSSELIYVVDVESLYSVKCKEYNSVSIHYLDTVDGKRIELYLKMKPFEPENHKMKFKEYEEERDYNDCEEIDGYFPWGGYYGCPRKEIEKVNIKVNGVSLANETYFKDLYDIDIEVDTYREFFDPNPSLKYDIKTKNFHFYILGGNAWYLFRKNSLHGNRNIEKICVKLLPA